MTSVCTNSDVKAKVEEWKTIEKELSAEQKNGSLQKIEQTVGAT